MNEIVAMKWKKKSSENVVHMRDVCTTYEIFKFLLHQNFLRRCTKPECMIVAQDYAKFKNLIVFGTKFVPLEMKTFVNIGNNFRTVITL